MAQKIAKIIDVSRFSLIRSAEAVGGYINFHVELAVFSRLTLESARGLDTEYGYVTVKKPRKTVVEHTSVNPIHPIHIGQGRNPMLGDALARILKARGHTVFRHYYIDDVGRQSAVIAYGYEKLGQPKPKGKPDHFIGVIYTITSCIMEVNRLNKEIEQTTEETPKLQHELDDWTSVADDLRNKFPKLFTQLFTEINKDGDPESEVNNLILGYESGEDKAKHLIRQVCQLCMEGFKETLTRAQILYDSWDWESDVVWSGDVMQILDKLKTTPYVFELGGILEFDAEKVAKDLHLKAELGLMEDYEVPSLTLIRADGTTLYTTRDIPYSLWKFQKAERVINVIGMDQTLSQMQLKLALYALGYAEHAENLIHFAYNLVRLPGYRMSGRRGRYITLDEVMDEAIKRAYEEVCKRSPRLSDAEKRRISNFVGIGL
jgi:arginyl-tRNA synthetase